jgi:hypothetical protein
VGQRARLVNRAGDEWVDLAAYDANEAAGYLARFWTRTLGDQTCEFGPGHVLRRSFGDTQVTLAGYTSGRAVDAVADRLVSVNAERYRAFQEQVREQAPGALLWSCRTVRRDVVVTGSDGDLRYAMSFPTGPTHRRLGAFPCAAFTLGVETYDNVGFGYAGPTDSAPTGIEVLNVGSTEFIDGETNISLVGGTVPAGTSRVVIEHGPMRANGAVGEAAHAGGRHYFAGPVPRQPGLIALSPFTITAFDLDGRELAHWTSP